MAQDGFHWYTRPPFGAQPDRTHPLCPDLACCLVNEGGGSRLTNLCQSAVGSSTTVLTTGGAASAATWVGGKDGAALSLATQYVDCGPIPNTYLFPNGLTAWAWVYTTSIAATQNIIGCDSSSTTGFFLVIRNTGLIRGTIRVGGSNVIASSVTALSLKTWYHVGMTWDGATVKVTVNGKVEGSTAAVGAYATGNANLTAGASGTTPNFVGQMGPFGVATRYQPGIGSLYADPYAFVQAPNHRRWYAAAGAALSRLPRPAMVLCPPPNPSLFQ